MKSDRPSAAELVAAAREHLERLVVPALGDPKLRYQTLVAAHVLSIVQRELEASEREGSAEAAREREEARALCAAIRGGAVADRGALFARLRRETLAKLAVANPAYRSLPRAAAPALKPSG